MPDRSEPGQEQEQKSAVLRLAEAMQNRPLTSAAIVGGAVAAGAGAFIGARALASRNGARDGRPVSSVLENAITACEAAAASEATDPDAIPVGMTD